MKRYKRIIEDTANDREIIDTEHAIERHAERYASIYTKEKIDSVIRKVMSIILTKHKDKKCQYGFHSKSTQIGGIISWDKYGDRNKDTGKNNAVIVTLFPPKKVHTFRDTCADIIVENQIIFSLRKNKKFIERRKLKNQTSMCEVYYLDDNRKSFISFFEGKVYDSSIKEYIVVD